MKTQSKENEALADKLIREIEKNERRKQPGQNIARIKLDKDDKRSVVCEGCYTRYKRAKNVIFYKGKYLCTWCRRKIGGYIESSKMATGTFSHTIQEICDEVREVKAYGSNRDCVIHVPLNMLGAKVKLVIVEQPFPMEELRDALIENTYQQLKEEEKQLGLDEE